MWYESLSIFVETERAIPKANHMQLQGWLRNSIEALLQSFQRSLWRQITDRESQKEAKNQRNENQASAGEAYENPDLPIDSHSFVQTVTAGYISIPLFVIRKKGVLLCDSL